ncbi:MAG: family N-acetyltransferase [Ilumatobacteraceae bacterium]|nr:family N-acetyltransferase [Ilumatobacteraceae bacterium]
MSQANEQAVLRTGEQIVIARAEPADLISVTAFYAALDDDSTYFRFFGIRRQIPVAELRQVVGGLDDHVTLLARMDGRLVGIGEYIIGNDPTEAEVAFAVADDHHREGVATLLLERLAVSAHEDGLLRLCALVLAGNADMQLVFRTVGLPVVNTFEDGIVHTSLDVTSLGSLRDAIATRHETTNGSGEGGLTCRLPLSP